MKSKPASDSCSTEGLTFAWRRGDEALVRFWCALLLAGGLFFGAWLAFRIVVPAAMAEDQPRVERAQLILVNEESHPSLRRLLADRNLPSLGIEQSPGTVPLVEDMMALLGLEEEREVPLKLYPAPEVAIPARWPKEKELAMVLPKLPALDESSWPQIEPAEPGQWAVKFSIKEPEGEVMAEPVAPWRLPVPAIRQGKWRVVIDADERLVFATPMSETSEDAQKEIRGLLQKIFEVGQWSHPPRSGLVELSFLKIAE
jgi:hypothetical protein